MDFPTPKPAFTQEIISGAPVTYRGILERAFRGEASPRQAIKAQCLICVGFHREDVRTCSSSSCPLWDYRPYQEKKDETIR